MNIEAYFRSLSDECVTLKDRVRYLIEDSHWPTDGEWKESVLRSMIRRSAPDNVTVGRGFVVSHQQCSTQIDVLLYDNNFPVLYKDGDLVFITPASCRAIIEVKSSITLTQFTNAAAKLAKNAELIRQHGMGIPLFVGLFSYELQRQRKRVFVSALQDTANGNYSRLIDHVSLGPSSFIKYWETAPGDDQTGYDMWHLYKLNQMAPGYFIHNLLATVSSKIAARREEAWFPQESKETRLEWSLPFHSD